MVVEVEGVEEGLKCWIFENDLRQYRPFREKLGHMEAHSVKEPLNII